MHRVKTQNFMNKITGSEDAALCFLVYSLAVGGVERDLHFVSHSQSSFPVVSCLTAVKGGGR